MKPSRILLSTLLVLAVVLSFQVAAIYSHSLTGDGSHHLVAGYQALEYGQNSVNLEHPPLAKLLMAFPSWWSGELEIPEITAREAHRTADSLFLEPSLGTETVRARWAVLLLLALPLLLSCYWLAFGVLRDRGSDLDQAHRAGTLLVLLMGLSLSVLPYLTILQTDVAVALAFVLVMLAGRGYRRNPGWQSALAVGLALGLGLASKFSAVLLLPAVAVIWFSGGERRRWRPWLSQGLIMTFGAISLLHGVFWLANLQYDSEVGREVLSQYCRGEGTVIVEDRLLDWEKPLLALEEVDPYLAQWAVGFLGVRAQNSIGVYTSYAFGDVRSTGRWWYFPAVFLVKTPWVILLAWVGCLVGLARRGTQLLSRGSHPMILASAIYLALALFSNYNLGVRHLLPVMPFLFLPVASVWSRSPVVGVVGPLLLFVESLAVAPLWMSSTNTWFLGRANPTRFALAAGNLEYRQNFLLLGRWAEENEVSDIKVLYPTVPREVIEAYVAGGRAIVPGEDVSPGWYAVSVTVEQLIPAILATEADRLYDGEGLQTAAEMWRPLWEEVAAFEDRGWVAGTFHIYYVAP